MTTNPSHNPSAEADTGAKPDNLNLDALASEAVTVLAGEIDPGATVTAPGSTGATVTESPALTAQQVMPWAYGLLKGGLGAVTKKTGVEYSEATITEGAQLLAPVLAKHQVMPAWLIPYKDEFALGMWAAGVAFNTWQLIEADKAEKAKARSLEPTA